MWQSLSVLPNNKRSVNLLNQKISPKNRFTCSLNGSNEGFIVSYTESPNYTYRPDWVYIIHER